VSFFCSLLESVLLSTSISHASILEREGEKTGRLWLELKSHHAVRPLTAILTLNTIAHTVAPLASALKWQLRYQDSTQSPSPPAL
jgi:hypothetical protein